MGRSAGAHLATLTAISTRAIAFRALINYYGRVNLTQGYLYPPIPDPINSRQVLRDFLGGRRKLSPISIKQHPQ